MNTAPALPSGVRKTNSKVLTEWAKAAIVDAFARADALQEVVDTTTTATACADGTVVVITSTNAWIKAVAVAAAPRPPQFPAEPESPAS